MYCLHSFTYIESLDIDPALMYKLNKVIEENEGIFYTYNKTKERVDEAKARALEHAIRKYNSEKDHTGMVAYIRTLAEHIMKKNKHEEMQVDFIEEVVSDDDDDDVNFGDRRKRKTDNEKHQNYRDFTDTIHNDSERRTTMSTEVITFILQYLSEFLKICEAIITKNTTPTYYRKEFKAEILKLGQKYKDLNQQLVNLYYEYGNEIQWFLDLEGKTSVVDRRNWKRANYKLIETRQSKKIKFVNSVTGNDIINADLETFKVKGGLNNYKVVKISYEDLYDDLLNRVEEADSNELKLVIRDFFLIRTLANSVSINTDYNAIYDLIKAEIVTNILTLTNCRLLNIGTESVYVLNETGEEITIQDMEVNGVKIHFDIEDITKEIIEV